MQSCEKKKLSLTLHLLNLFELFMVELKTNFVLFVSLKLKQDAFKCFSTSG